MTQYCCKRCGRIHYGNHNCMKHISVPEGWIISPECLCSGEDHGVVPPDPIASAWRKEVASVCNSKCEHWGRIGKSTGCLLIPKATASEPRPGKPCDIGFYHAKGRQCFACPPKFLPRDIDKLCEITQPSLDRHCVAVTSLSLLPHHLDRQAKCLESWRRFGFSVVAVNRHIEIPDLRVEYPQVSEWIGNDAPLSDYSWYTQKINDLADVATRIRKTVLLINSDIEIYGDQQKITDPLENGDQIVGIRWNYDGNDYRTARRELWGLDAFSFTPDQAASLPRLPMRIGRPLWDYWIPLHARLNNWPMHFVGERLFLHQSHKIHWSKSDWDMAARWVSERYDYVFEDLATNFRNSLPYPPDQVNATQCQPTVSAPKSRAPALVTSQASALQTPQSETR